MSEVVPEAAEAVPENMQLVIDRLQAHPGIVVVGGYERVFLDQHSFPPGLRTHVHTLEIFTHPVTPLYEAEPLNELATELMSGIQTTHVHPAQWRSYGTDIPPSLELPYWHVDDVIGTISLQGSVTVNPQLIAAKTEQIADTPLAYSLDMRQRTIVTIFPDFNHVAEAAGVGAMSAARWTIARARLGKSSEGDVSNLHHAPALGYPPNPDLDALFALRDLPEHLWARMI